MEFLLSARDVRERAAALGIRPTKTWGQNFVIDPNTVRKIVAVAGVEPGDHVIEVGPGLGSLTLGLLEAGARVSAIEIDPALAAALPETVSSMLSRAGADPSIADSLSIVPADAMTVTELPGSFGAPLRLVANLPYNVSVPVLLHLFATFDSLQSALVMVQSEVAERLSAAPGSRIYGVPSVKAQWYADVRRAANIGRNVFWPAPNVDSGLVAFARRPAPETSASRHEVFALVDAGFAQRRKTLRAALSQVAGGGDRAEWALRQAGIDPRTRAERLRIEEFARVAEALAAH